MSTATSPQPALAETPPPISVPVPAPAEIALRVAPGLSAGIREWLTPLVHQIFLSGTHKNIRHIVVFGVDSDQKIGAICEGIAHLLASRTTSEIAIVEASADNPKPPQPENAEHLLEGTARQIASGLWQVKVDMGGNCWSIQDHESRGPANIRRLHSDFDCTITHTPPLTRSSLGAVMGCFSDGIILVVQAGKTRRAAAQSCLELLRRNKVRVLGTILDDRRFPIPKSLYERL